MIHRTHFLLAYFFLCLFSPPLHAYPVSPFNAQQLLNMADVVCYGKATLIQPHTIQADINLSPPVETPGTIATVTVISLIKGTAPTTINVVFRKSSAMVSYTQLEQDESAILFLKAKQDHFRFVDDHNGKLQVPPHEPLSYKSSSPKERMAAELMFASQADTGAGQLNAMEQLGYFALPEVISRLNTQTAVSDMAVQGVAYASLIRLDNPPPAARLVAFFLRQDDLQSLKRFQTTAFDNSQLKANILSEMATRFNIIGRDFDNEYANPKSIALKKSAREGAQRWKSFDLIGFLKVALANIPRNQNDSSTQVGSRRDIAEILNDQIDVEGKPALLKYTFRNGSRGLAIQLLNSPDLEVSEAAARTIDNMIAAKHTFPFPRGGRQDTVRYVTTVRQWIKKNPHWLKSDQPTLKRRP